MKERPIILKPWEVRAFLDGRKTQLRRIVKDSAKHGVTILGDNQCGVLWDQCPFGGGGDRLWVKETWRLYDSSSECACYDDCTCSRFHGKPLYRASHDDLGGPWKPSVSMPRWASRITLEIIGIRVERLQDISEEDAKAEGFDGQGRHNNPRYEFMDRWIFLHGSGSWNENPWVWVIEVEPVC